MLISWFGIQICVFVLKWETLWRLFSVFFKSAWMQMETSFFSDLRNISWWIGTVPIQTTCRLNFYNKLPFGCDSLTAHAGEPADDWVSGLKRFPFLSSPYSVLPDELAVSQICRSALSDSVLFLWLRRCWHCRLEFAPFKKDPYWVSCCH